MENSRGPRTESRGTLQFIDIHIDRCESDALTDCILPFWYIDNQLHDVVESSASARNHYYVYKFIFTDTKCRACLASSTRFSNTESVL